MSIQKKDPEISALELVHSALKGLDPDARRRVLASIFQLLEIKAFDAALGTQILTETYQQPVKSTEIGTRSRSPRPVSLIELIQEKKPGTSAQFITLFAYYRERYQGLPRFSRNDLESYFSKAKENPPKNYDRDFVESVKKGWIHEDGEDSYLTSKGLEVVESGFPGERKYISPGKHARRKKSK